MCGNTKAYQDAQPTEDHYDFQPESCVVQEATTTAMEMTMTEVETTNQAR
jgi:hypothetical protein